MSNAPVPASQVLRPGNRGGARNRLTFCAVLGTVLAGCGDTGSTRLAVAVRDSAGVRIVESSAPAWSAGQAWRLGVEPVLHIGVANGEEALQFQDIAGVDRLSDGRILIGDGPSAQLRVFHPDGRWAMSVGRTGDGPGELSHVEEVYALRGDSLAARTVTEVVVFAPDGRPVRKLRPQPAAGERFANLITVLDDGTIVSATFPRIGVPDTGAPRDSLLFHRHAPTGELRGRMGGHRWVELIVLNGVGRQPLLSRVAPFTFAGDRLYVARLDRFEIQVIDSTGRTERILRRQWSMIEVSEEHRERHRAAVMNAPGERGTTPTPQIVAARRRRLNDVPFVTHFSPTERIFVADDGHVWVRHLDQDRLVDPRAPGNVARPGLWSVFDPGGRWLGEVTTPVGFQPRTIRDREILGVWTDEADVQYVRVYEIIKP